MTEIKEFLKELISAPSPSGHEHTVREIIEKEWRPLTDEMKVSPTGSLHALKKGSGKGPRPAVMLAAHMDAIGFVTSEIVKGFIRFVRIGGIDPRVLPGQPVWVHGRETLPGIIVMPRPELAPPGYGEKPMPMDYLYVDVGLPPHEVEALVRVGDIITYAQEPLELSGDTLAGHTLDDRAAVASVTVCLQELQRRVHTWDVWATATVQEETSFAGGYTSAFGIHPDLGVAIDVCHARGPGTSEPFIPHLGKGLELAPGPNVHPSAYKLFKDVADEIEIPYQLSVMATHSGTDAYPIQVTAGGIPTMVISIPLRYMHTPVETVSMKDIKRVGRLMAEVIARLDDKFLQALSWD